MSHSDRTVEFRIVGNRGDWFVSFDPDSGDVSLRDAEEVRALAPAAHEEIREFTTSRLPTGLHLPSAGLDGGWSLLYFPADGRLLLHNPFGSPIATTADASAMVETLRTLFA